MLSPNAVEEPATSTQAGKTLHLVLFESAAYRTDARSKPTWCGSWAPDNDLADRPDEVTCPECREAFKKFDEMAF